MVFTFQVYRRFYIGECLLGDGFERLLMDFYCILNIYDLNVLKHFTISSIKASVYYTPQCWVGNLLCYSAIKSFKVHKINVDSGTCKQVLRNITVGKTTHNLQL